MKKIVILVTFIALGAGSVFAQGYTSIHYDISIPLGATSDAAGKVSFRGVGLDYRRMINANIAAGFSLGWQVFYERKDNATYVDGSTSLTGIQFSYVNALPMHANIGYYFGAEGDAMRPFIGTGIGTTYFENRKEMGQWSSTIQNWQFSIQPEVGLLYEVNPSSSVFAAAKYTQGFKTSELDGQSYISLNFGVALKF